MKFFILMILSLFQLVSHSQITVSGTVYDSTKLYSLSNVKVTSTGGDTTKTDSAGVYHLKVNPGDSISFYYKDKSTLNFAVNTIAETNAFDISLLVRARERYKPLKEIYVFSSYKKDSAENRITYGKTFNYNKPTLRSTYTPGYTAGLDVNELINIFRFRRNKHELQFQKRLLQEEEDKYVSYRFNARLIKRVTGLSGDMLTKYMAEYKPDYEFVTGVSEVEYYEYILGTAATFKKQNNIN
ncbi:MAG: hypothetical protein ABIR81_07765 [Ginsengibacter sp.]